MVNEFHPITPENPRGAGPKPLYPGKKFIGRLVYVLPSQREKLKTLGGSKWVRPQIDNAKLQQQ